MSAIRVFASPEALARELATEVSDLLAAALAEREAAALVVSGGTTPVPFFRSLRTRTVDWRRVVVTLADDRWVPAEHPRSNAGLVRRELLAERASAARFVPLAGDEETPEAGVGAAERRLTEVPRPFDVVVLGMGTDGHTASLFPDAAETAGALDPASTAPVTAVRPGGLEPRITQTLAALAAARRVFLHVTGEEKRRVAAAALEGKVDLPVGRVLSAAGERAAVFWAP